MLKIEKGIWQLNSHSLVYEHDTIKITLLFMMTERDEIKLWSYPIEVMCQEWCTEKDALDVIELIGIARKQINLPQKPERNLDTIEYIKF